MSRGGGNGWWGQGRWQNRSAACSRSFASAAGSPSCPRSIPRRFNHPSLPAASCVCFESDSGMTASELRGEPGGHARQARRRPCSPAVKDPRPSGPAVGETDSRNCGRGRRLAVDFLRRVRYSGTVVSSPALCPLIDRLERGRALRARECAGRPAGEIASSTETRRRPDTPSPKAAESSRAMPSQCRRGNGLPASGSLDKPLRKCCCSSSACSTWSWRSGPS